MRSVEGRLKAVTPIAHSAGSDGISSSLRREPFIIGERVVQIPIISGNAIRGVLRRQGARFLLAQLLLEPNDLPPLAYHLLVDGGIIQEAVHIAPDPDFFRQVRSLLPHIDLFGGCVRQTPISGKLIVHPAIPICKETEPVTGVKSKVRLEDLITEVMFTRRDDREVASVGTVQMRYLVECFAPGTEFVHSFIIKDDSPLLWGAFNAALSGWKGMPYIGGRSSAGLGRVEMTYEVDEKAVDDYEKFIRSHEKEIKDILFALGD